MLNRRDLIVGAAAGLAAAGSPLRRTQAADNWDAVVVAAKKEGHLVLYTGNVGAKTQGQVASAFTKKYGISVDILEVRGAEARERLRVEQAAGRFTADVAQNGTTLATLMLRDNLFQPHGGIPGIARITPPLKATDYFVPSFTFTYGILVNTQLVKPADEPKSWMDLTDPKWKGKIVCDDPRVPGGGSVFFFATYDDPALGRKFHEKFAPQIQISPIIRESERRVARGEFAMWVPQQVAGMPGLKGLPVKLIVPQEGLPYIAYVHAMVRNAPHPNAARLFMDYYLSDEAQMVYANAANIPVVSSVIDKLDPEHRALLSGKLLGTTDIDRVDQMVALAKSIYL